MKFKNILMLIVVWTIMVLESQAQVREKFDSSNPSNTELVQNVEKHKLGDLDPSRVKDFLEAGSEAALAVVRFRSPEKGIFWVTLPRLEDSVPRRIVSVTCLGKKETAGDRVGEGERAWSFSGCAGKTPRFRFEFDGGETIVMKLQNPPGKAAKGTIGVILWDWKGRGVKAVDNTDWGHLVQLTEVDRRLSG